MDKFIKRKHNSDDCESESERSSKATRPNVNKVKEKLRPNRQYCNSYLNFGFSWTGNQEKPFPLCVVCGEKMSNEAMLPSKLKRHFTTKHPFLQGKDSNYFKRMTEQQSKQGKSFRDKLTISEKAQIASIEVSEMIAQKMKSHTLAESIILPACRIMVKRMLGNEAEQAISKIPLSNNTVHRRIMELSSDIEKNVFDKLQNSEFALQVDESTDISNKAQLLTFIRFIDGDQIINQFFCCKEMPRTTRGQDVFEILSTYLEKWKLSWKSCIGICTDGAPSMVGCIKGFASLVKQQNPNVIQTHCFLHREVLVSKTLAVELKKVLDQVVEMVNFIKSRPLKTRLFEQICIEMDSQHRRLILHTEIRWLSRGKVLCRIHELQKELLAFFEEEKQERFCEYLRHEFWISKLEYLTDIFTHLNSVNTSLQGRNENILSSTDKLIAFQKKISIWKNRAKDGNFEMFPLMGKTNIKEMTPIVVEHLATLAEKIKFYFPTLNTDDYDWVRNPFIKISSNVGLKLSEEEELVSLSSDRGLKIKHVELPIDTFWISIREEYPSVAKKALSILMQFSTSYLCELGFSSLTNIKLKKRERLQCVEDDMRVCLSQIRPCIKNVAAKHQAQISH